MNPLVRSAVENVAPKVLRILAEHRGDDLKLSRLVELTGEHPSIVAVAVRVLVDDGKVELVHWSKSVRLAAGGNYGEMPWLVKEAFDA